MVKCDKRKNSWNYKGRETERPDVGQVKEKYIEDHIIQREIDTD